VFFITSYFTERSNTGYTARALAGMFGLADSSGRRVVLCEELKIDLSPGQILFITGPSGSGKTCLLQILKRCFWPYLDLNEIVPDPEKILPDQFDLPLPAALEFLSLAGLADATIFLRTPGELSDGQRFRFQLALALARKPKYLFIDRFADDLDRLTAQILAVNIRKFATRFNTAFVLASPNSDFIDQLRPEVYVEKLFSESPRIVTRNLKPPMNTGELKKEGEFF
jgi:uncharacterized protein